MKIKSITIVRKKLLSTKGNIKTETPNVESLPLNGELSMIISQAIKSHISKENKEQ